MATVRTSAHLSFHLLLLLQPFRGGSKQKLTQANSRSRHHCAEEKETSPGFSNCAIQLEIQESHKQTFSAICCSFFLCDNKEEFDIEPLGIELFNFPLLLFHLQMWYWYSESRLTTVRLSRGSSAKWMKLEVLNTDIVQDNHQLPQYRSIENKKLHEGTTSCQKWTGHWLWTIPNEDSGSGLRSTANSSYSILPESKSQSSLHSKSVSFITNFSYLQDILVHTSRQPTLVTTTDTKKAVWAFAKMSNCSAAV